MRTTNEAMGAAKKITSRRNEPLQKADSEAVAPCSKTGEAGKRAPSSFHRKESRHKDPAFRPLKSGIKKHILPEIHFKGKKPGTIALTAAFSSYFILVFMLVAHLETHDSPEDILLFAILALTVIPPGAFLFFIRSKRPGKSQSAREIFPQYIGSIIWSEDARISYISPSLQSWGLASVLYEQPPPDLFISMMIKSAPRLPKGIKTFLLHICRNMFADTPFYHDVLSNERKEVFVLRMTESSKGGTVCEMHDITPISRLVMPVKDIYSALIEDAHDLNNVLAIMEGYTGLLARSDKLDSSSREYAEKILAAGQRGKFLIHSLNNIGTSQGTENAHRKAMKERALTALSSQGNKASRQEVPDDEVPENDADAGKHQQKAHNETPTQEAKQGTPVFKDNTMDKNHPTTGTEKDRQKKKKDTAFFEESPQPRDQDQEPGRQVSVNQEKETGLPDTTGGNASKEKAPNLPSRAKICRILLVERQVSTREDFEQKLHKAGLEVISTENGNAALLAEGRESAPIDFLLCGLDIGAISRPKFIEIFNSLRPATQIFYLVDNNRGVCATDEDTDGRYRREKYKSLTVGAQWQEIRQLLLSAPPSQQADPQNEEI